tara:strand:- start:341 stop:589 length:249 start_codon:yes stop_codon:yes gene_type:complete
MSPNPKIWLGIKRQRSILTTQKIQAEITSELLNSHKILTEVIPAPVTFCTPRHAEFEQKNQTYANFDPLLIVRGSRALVTNQ